MTPQQFRDTLARLGLRQVDAAALLGVTPRCIHRYCTGARKIPGPVITALMLMTPRDAA